MKPIIHLKCKDMWTINRAKQRARDAGVDADYDKLVIIFLERELSKLQEELKHGKWNVDNEYGLVCSVCGYMKFDYSTMPYCAACGAKMDEEE